MYVLSMNKYPVHLQVSFHLGVKFIMLNCAPSLAPACLKTFTLATKSHYKNSALPALGLDSDICHLIRG